MNQSFASLGLSAEFVRAVTEEGYTEPTPVQVQAIPVILAGRDVLAGAQTGTGKTAGFALPLLQRLETHSHHGGRHAVRALILTPTRELAAQVEQSVRTYGKHSRLRSTLIYGGVGFQPQVEALKRGVDILVATPGRLLDHVSQKTLNLGHVEILVLDEADRMLDMGFIHDIRKVLALLPKQRQNLLFSATFSDEIRALAGGLLRDPAMIDVARRNAESELVVQRLHPVDHARKRELLAHLVTTGDWRQVLVFTRTKHGANALAQRLVRDGIEAVAIHGNKSQNARTRALAGFKSGEVRVLVATDIAARGLDIEELPHVVNYELPNVPEDYVHRIGRTGRAGSVGEAISLVCAEEREHLAGIERLMGRRIERAIIAGFEPGAGSESARAEAPRPAREPQRARQPQRAQHRKASNQSAAVAQQLPADPPAPRVPVDTATQRETIDDAGRREPIDAMEEREPIDAVEERQPIDAMEEREPIDALEDRQPIDTATDRLWGDAQEQTVGPIAERQPPAGMTPGPRKPRRRGKSGRSGQPGQSHSGQQPRPQGEHPQRPQGAHSQRPQGEHPQRPQGPYQPRPQGANPQRPQGPQQPRPQGANPQRSQGPQQPRPQGAQTRAPQPPRSQSDPNRADPQRSAGRPDHDADSERQPASNANAQFPSSGQDFTPPPRPRGTGFGGQPGRARSGPVPALFRRPGSRND